MTTVELLLIAAIWLNLLGAVMMLLRLRPYGMYLFIAGCAALGSAMVLEVLR